LAEYVEEMYDDDDRREVVDEAGIEVRYVIQKLAKGKAVGEDNIPVEFLERGIELITKLMNEINRTGKLPEDFRKKYIYCNTKSVKSTGVP
jgi:hypothetical protein